MATVTVEDIKRNVATNPLWAERAILALYAKQTTTEQVIEQTHEKNFQGFNGVDAGILSSFAKQIQRGHHLSMKQQAIAFKKLPKYAGQLYRIAEERAH